MKARSMPGRIGQFLLDLLEIYIPAAAFTGMFVIFVIAIFFRYFLNSPLTWPYELTIIGFIWTIMFGAGLAKREDSHVVFSVMYDRMNPRAQLRSRLVAEAVVLVTFAWAFLPSAQYITEFRNMTTAALRIPLDIVFFPFIVFMALMIGRSCFNLVRDINLLRKGEEAT